VGGEGRHRGEGVTKLPLSGRQGGEGGGRKCEEIIHSRGNILEEKAPGLILPKLIFRVDSKRKEVLRGGNQGEAKILSRLQKRKKVGVLVERVTITAGEEKRYVPGGGGNSKPEGGGGGRSPVLRKPLLKTNEDGVISSH